MTSSRSPRALTAAPAVAVLLAAACGSDGAAAPERPATPPTMVAPSSTATGGDTDGGGSGDGDAEAGGQRAAVGPDEVAQSAGPAGIYDATTGELDPSVADIPRRVYVPNSNAGTVSVVDPETYQVVETHTVGTKPHHVTPSWDMQTLYALDTAGNQLIPLDPRTAQPGEPIPVEDPYNLYFTPDGDTAVVVAERLERLDLRDPETWELRASIPVPYAGVNHADFSEDGRYLYVSAEWSGWVAKVDLQEQDVAAAAQVGEEPIDVKLSPSGDALFVADQSRHGVMVLDPEDLTERAFLPTGEGAHGLYYSRDVTELYVSNRLGGSVSVIDVADRSVSETWPIPGGGSPDMGGVSADGSELWLSGRYHGEVYVFDTGTGEVVHRIPTGEGAHGLSVHPQPGRFSTGHTGVMR